MDFKDYYSALGVTKTSTDKEIKAAYRKLARKHHPDVNPNDAAAEAKFKEINEAFEVLGDPDKRKKYDELGANWRAYEQAQQAYGGQARTGSPFAGWPAGADQSYRIEFDSDADFDDAGPFSDFFRTFFGGGAGRDHTRSPRRGRTGRQRIGNDLEQDVHLTLDDAFRGTTRRVSIKFDGHARTVDVRIPAGVKDGARVRVSGEGEPGAGGGHAGDLYLNVKVLPDDRFERRGQDLHARIDVPITTAVLGGETQVTTIAGKTLRLRIPEATQSGQVFRLRGHGMPTVGAPDERGDLYATIDISVPRTLTPEQRAHYEALARLEHDTTGTA